MAASSVEANTPLWKEGSGLPSPRCTRRAYRPSRPWRTAVPRSTRRFSASSARNSEAIRSHTRRSGAITRRSTKNSGRCWMSSPPRSSASSTIERSRIVEVVSALTRQVGLVALVQALGVALEQRRRGRHRHLHECLACACAHHGHQPVHQGLALVLEAVEHLARLMNSACFFSRNTAGGDPGRCRSATRRQFG